MDEMSARKEKPKSEEPSHPFFPEAKLSREAGEQSLMLRPAPPHSHSGLPVPVHSSVLSQKLTSTVFMVSWEEQKV